jgi:hypothetical protein
MKLRIELEQTDWQHVLILLNAGGVMLQSGLAPGLLGKITEQLNQPAAPKANGEDGARPDQPNLT